MDASSQAIYNRVVEFEHGTTKVVPGLAESWEVSPDGLDLHLQAPPGVKFHTTDYFTPTRDLNADDVVFTFERQLNKDDPWFDYAGGTWEYFNSMSMPEIVKSIEKVDDMTVKLTLNRPDATMLANLAMDFASVVSKEYADKLARRRHARAARPAAGRHRPVPVRRLPEGRGHPLQGQSRLLARQAARSTT